MKDMPERDLLPKNMMKVPEVYSLYCRSSYKEGEEEGRGRGEKGEEGKGVYIHCIVTMSLCLCTYVKKS